MQGLCNDSCNDMKRGQTKGHTVCIFKFMRKVYLYTVYIYLIQNTFGVKKARPSKVESYLEVNT